MIAYAVVDEIRRLLDEGELSQRKISRRVAVSRGTVGAIAQGTRPDYEARRRAHGDNFEPPQGLPRRCPRCGAMVQMPCLACRVRVLRKTA